MKTNNQVEDLKLRVIIYYGEMSRKFRRKPTKQSVSEKFGISLAEAGKIMTQIKSEGYLDEQKQKKKSGKKHAR